MRFLFPAFLWSLLALIPLAAIYFLKVRPRKKTTSAYFLWEKIFSEKKATSLFNKLRDLFSLLLLLLAFALLAFALARPEIGTDERKDLLILIDHSASMGARDGIKTRLDTALDAAREIAIAMDGNQRAAVASVSKEIEFRTHLSESPRELIDAINSIEPTIYPLAKESIEGIGKDAHWSSDYRIMLISDGCFQGATNLPKNIELLKVGAPAENLGIIGADMERLPDGRLGFYYQIASSFPDKVEADLILRQEESGQIAKLIPLEIEPGTNRSETFYLEDVPNGKWIAEIDLTDSFAADNIAYLAVPPPRPVRVSVDANNRFFFETSVLAFQKGGGLLQLVDDNADIAIEQGQSGASADLSIVFTPDGESPYWKSLGENSDAVAPREVIQDHPVLRHVDISGLVFIGAKTIEPSDGSIVLVESENGNPLIYRATHEGKTALVVNLDPVESDFYFSAWFPVLVHGAATHLAGREEPLDPVYRPGDIISILGFREGIETKLAVPDKDPITITEHQYGPISRLGFFDFSNPAGEWPVASSLLSQAESLLNNEPVVGSNDPISRGHSPAYWLIVLAILLLTTESILYHLRKVG